MALTEAVSREVEQRQIKIFPSQKKETIKPAHLHLKLQPKASKSFLLA